MVEILYFNITGIPEILAEYNTSDEKPFKLHILFGVDPFGLVGI